MPDSVDSSTGPNRRSAGSESDCRLAGEPFMFELATIGYEVARNTLLRPDLAQAIRVRAVARTDDEDKFDQSRELAHRCLAVLSCIADVADLWTHHVFEPHLDGFDRGTRVVDAQRGL